MNDGTFSNFIHNDYVFAGQRGFRRSRQHLKNSLRLKRSNGKRLIKVCHQTDTTSTIAASISRLTCLGVFPARSVKATGIGRLLVTILEATELKAAKPNGECGHAYIKIPVFNDKKNHDCSRIQM